VITPAIAAGGGRIQVLTFLDSGRSDVGTQLSSCRLVELSLPGSTIREGRATAMAAYDFVVIVTSATPILTVLAVVARAAVKINERNRQADVLKAAIATGNPEIVEACRHWYPALKEEQESQGPVDDP
jgi:hypothetical protein